MLHSRILVFSRLIITSLFILLFHGCGDSALLDFYSGDDLLVQSLSPGTALEQGDILPVTLTSSEDSDLPSSLDLALYDFSGNQIKTWTMTAAPSIDALNTENLQSGFYTLTVEAGGSSNSGVLPFSLPFFITPGLSVIQGLSAYPPAAKPGEGMLFFADIEQSGYDNPFLRWTAGGKVLSSGLVEDGAALVSWQVPEIEGVYPVLVELFPYPPAPETEYEFVASERFRMEAFVSSDPGPVRGELAPEESFSTLFHFRGTTESDGFIPDIDLSLVSNPELAVEEGVFGFRFSTEDSLIAAAADSTHMFPVSRGIAGPCTIEIKGLFQSPGHLFSLYSMSGEVEEAVVSAILNTEGLQFILGDQQEIFPLSPGFFSSPRFLALSILPRKGSTGVYFYVDGRLRDTRTLYASPLPAVVNKLEIGAGFSGVLDEFGIYLRKADGSSGTDSTLFAAAMKDRYGKRLLAAEGFDGGIPDSLLLPGSGGITVSDSPGSLKIEESGSAGFPVPVPKAAEGAVELHLAGDNHTGSYEIRSKSSAVLLSGDLSRELFRMEWKVLSDAVLIRGPGGNEVRFPYSDAPGDLELWLGGNGTAFRIDDFLILKSELQLSGNSADSNSAGV